MRGSRTAALVAAVAAGAVVATAAPAAAATPLPDCVVVLGDAASGAAGSCDTYGPPPMANTTFGAYRTVHVVVTSGAVAATIACAGAGPDHSVPVTTSATFGGWGGSGACTLTLTALESGTTAAGWSHGFYAGTF